ncbi:MAG: VWA domain-containing protein, partial [Boseongicola sp.]|nr:VWA domain-containing protein [Boseongicola sp.]
MSDDFDDIRRAFKEVTPDADPDRKRATLARAQENFDAIQGSVRGVRHKSERGIWSRAADGVTTMIDALTTRGGLTATTALVAVGLVMVTPQGRNLLTPPSKPATVSEDQPLIVFEEPAIDGKVERREMAEADLADAIESPAPELGIVAEEVFVDDLGGQSLERARPVEQFAISEAASPSAKRLIVEPEIGIVVPESDTEAFSNAESSPLKVTTEEPVSTFSIDVDTASYSIIRSSLTRGMLPPKDAVRIEEIVNYFPYAYPEPDSTHPFEPTISVLPSPWNSGTELVHIGIQGELPAIEDRPPLNLVFLIDTSGSMQDANKLPLLKQSFRMMLNELRPEDEVSIVTYAGSAGQVLEPTKAGERSTILSALDRLEAGGSTAGAAGIEQAYLVAEEMAGDGEVTRVLLATDGDFNVGVSDPAALEELIAEKRESGTYLSILGFGRGNLDDATMQALAQNGNGTAAYIDTLSEARKVLVDQLTGALFPIANDVKIQVEFNPAEVAEYRLIGYETRALAREDFNNDRVDAGDIGAGHRVTAIYEVTPVGSDAVRNTPLRYGDAEVVGDTSGELGFFKLRYKTPGATTSILLEQPIQPNGQPVSDDVEFSVAMAGFGQLLRDGDYLGDWQYSDAIEMATAARG